MRDTENTITPPRRRALVPAWAFVAAGVAAVAIIAAALLPLAFAPARSTTVPNVVGLDVPIARSRLAQAGILLEVGDRRFSSASPAGAVLEQSPAAGSVVGMRSTVVVVLSAGSEEFALPDVLGVQVAEAIRVLEEAGLSVTVERIAADEPSGTVVASVPAPGAPVRTSDDVRLSVAASETAGGGGALVPYKLDGACFVIDPEPLPRVSGLSTAPADAPLEVTRRLRSLLEASGAGVFVTRSVNDTAGTVTEQSRVARAAVSTCTAIVGLSVATDQPGAAVITLQPGGTDPTLYLPSTELARAIVTSLGESKVEVQTLTVQSDAVLAAGRMPAVRVRLGSAGSPKDRTSFRDPAWADTMARAIYRALGEKYSR